MAECLGKKRYKTEDEAWKGLYNLFISRTEIGADDMHVYRCPGCKKYHVGHKSYYTDGVRLSRLELAAERLADAIQKRFES